MPLCEINIGINLIISKFKPDAWGHSVVLNTQKSVFVNMSTTVGEIGNILLSE